MQPLAGDERRAEFWIRHVWVGVVMSEVCAALGLVYTVVNRQLPNATATGGIFFAVLVLSPLLLLLPHQRLVRHPRGMFFFYAWSAVIYILITALALLRDIPTESSFLLYVLALIYAGLAYPVAAVIVIGSFATTSYALVRLWDGDPVGDVVLAAGLLLATTAMCALIARSHWLADAERLRYEQRLRHLAFHDPLTGLVNRALFVDRVDHALSGRDRSQRLVAVLFCDLDDFKAINDRLGHSVGDQVLVAVADRLRGCVRIADTPGRLGGDEFAILLEDLAGPQDADATAERILRALQQPVVAHGAEVVVQASIGVAVADECIRSTDELLRSADLAMYATKAAGKERCQGARGHQRLETAQ
jgi:diguanylate cyclase (GGDEF)-like protein